MRPANGTQIVAVGRTGCTRAPVPFGHSAICTLSGSVYWLVLQSPCPSGCVPTAILSDCGSKRLNQVTSPSSCETFWLVEFPIIIMSVGVHQAYRCHSNSDHAFLSSWIAHYGEPQTITTDKRAQFKSYLWTQLMHLMGSTHTRIATYHSTCDRMVKQAATQWMGDVATFHSMASIYASRKAYTIPL